MKHITVIIGFFLAIAVSQPAEARKRGTTNQEIALVEDLPDTAEYQIDGSYVDVGYMYESTSLFTVPLWAEAATDIFVLYSETEDGYSYLPLNEAELSKLTAALGSDPTEGYSFSRWKHMWGIYPAGLLILFGLYSTLFGKKDDEEEA
ncbi:hypothetical protein GCM10009096_12750 [Parasphingorhabdus litoris]|uniref:DUF3592 domain-containing protein n=1 Tax=Parasphingorhabdus litoris TaxID=394733 RepID=A0ABN1ACC4_9SPHN|nr:hypothetical protein [Parasphingorhabdus litoris]